MTSAPATPVQSAEARYEQASADLFESEQLCEEAWTLLRECRDREALALASLTMERELLR